MWEFDIKFWFWLQAGVVSSMKEIRRNRTYYANKKAEEKKRRVADDSDETIPKKLDSVKKKTYDWDEQTTTKH